MKRVLVYFAAVAAVAVGLVSCSKALAPAEQSTTPLKAEGIDIKVSNITDNSFDVLLTPKGEASFYSYLVDDDLPAPDDMNAESLYGVSYKSAVKAVFKVEGKDVERDAAGTVEYKNNKTYSFTVKTEPNTNYTVYAVSSSKEGNVGAFSYVQVLTTDEGIPTIDKWASDEALVQVLFSEAVKYNEDIKITAKVWPKMLLDEEPVKEVEGAVEIDDDGIVNITFEDITIPGSWYLVSYPQGAFTDMVGNPCPALESSWIYNDDDEIEDVDGLGGYLENVAFDFGVEAIPTAIKDAAEPLSFAVENEIFDVNSKAKVEVSVVHKESGKTTTTTTTPAFGALDENTFAVILKEEPERGDLINITIPAESVTDIYGNTNNAVEIKDKLYSYGYTLEDDVLGVWTFHTTSQYASYGYGPYDDVLLISESDDPEKGNVMVEGVIAGTYDFIEEEGGYLDAPVKFYADFDCDLGTFTIPGMQMILTYNDPLLNDDYTDFIYDDEGHVVTEPTGIYMFLGQGSSIYSNDLGFDFPASHTAEWWYISSVFIGLMYGDVTGSPSSVGGSAFNILFPTAAGLEYTPDAEVWWLPEEGGEDVGDGEGGEGSSVPASLRIPSKKRITINPFKFSGTLAR